jgi:hypothetical protein
MDGGLDWGGRVEEAGTCLRCGAGFGRTVGVYEARLRTTT